MNTNSIKVHIIGGGISGLVAAQVLENNGLSPIILDAESRVGGRLKTGCCKRAPTRSRVSGACCPAIGQLKNI